jgi:hypothetical protein
MDKILCNVGQGFMPCGFANLKVRPTEKLRKPKGLLCYGLAFLILLSSQAFAQFTLTKNADNYKARKSTFQRWDGAATVQGQDTVYSTYRNCVNQGWHSVYIWANSADDSVDLMVQYQTVPDTVSPFIAKTIWTNIAALTDTQWIYPYQIYPVTSEFIRFRAYGGTDNDASTGSAFNLDDYGWNIE